MVVQRARWDDLDPVTAYRLLALRARVFVVEQACAYADPDGRDLEPGTEQWWVPDGEQVLACLRVLPEPGGVRRIGRVATDPAARGQGLAGQLLTAVLDAYPEASMVLAGQTYLTEWYARFGFVAEGGPFLEDGIPHRTMRLTRGISGG